MRIITAIKNKWPHLTRSIITKLIKNKMVKINGRVAKKIDVVGDDDKIKIPKEYQIPLLAANSKIECELIKKTKDYIFFYKPIRVHSVALSYIDTNSAANWLLSVDADLSEVSHPLESGLCHRLDYETSGVMVAARNKDAYEYLRGLFSKNKVTKIYKCLVEKCDFDCGVKEAFVKETSKRSKIVKLSEESENKQTKSPQKIITEIIDIKKQESDYELTIKLITGHRHQIRAHLALLGSPILGDELYAGKKAERLMLESVQISFQSRSGEVCDVSYSK